jgi:hypothetical protein
VAASAGGGERGDREGERVAAERRGLDPDRREEDRHAQDQEDIGDVGAHDVAERHIGDAGERRFDRGHELRGRSPVAHEGEADQEW